MRYESHSKLSERLIHMLVTCESKERLAQHGVVPDHGPFECTCEPAFSFNEGHGPNFPSVGTIFYFVSNSWQRTATATLVHTRCSSWVQGDELPIEGARDGGGRVHPGKAGAPALPPWWYPRYAPTTSHDQRIPSVNHANGWVCDIFSVKLSDSGAP